MRHGQVTFPGEYITGSWLCASQDLMRAAPGAHPAEPAAGAGQRSPSMSQPRLRCQRSNAGTAGRAGGPAGEEAGQNTNPAGRR